MAEAGKANGTNTASSASGAKTRSRPDNEYVLYSYGEPVAMSADGNASYFGTDILGSVRSVTDKYGAVQADYSYDAFGSPYLGNLENDVGFGYCGKSYDVGTGLYDYGFRDYSPVSARFTTVDPVRDGSNWFSYVVNDPVNYVDPLGLTASDSSWWSNAKSTVKGWIDSAKSDLIQTWNDIKGVVSTTISDTKAAVSSFISNAQANLSKWGAQAKAELTQLGARIIVAAGVNLFGVFGCFTTTQKLFNDALSGVLPDIITNEKDEEKGYGIADGLKGEIENTRIQGTNQSFTDAIKNAIVSNDWVDGTIFHVEVGKISGLTDMETSVGRYDAKVRVVTRINNQAVVNIEVANDPFDFNPDYSESGRQSSNEILTRLGAAAHLQTTIINVNYDLEINF